MQLALLLCSNKIRYFRKDLCVAVATHDFGVNKSTHWRQLPKNLVHVSTMSFQVFLHFYFFLFSEKRVWLVTLRISAGSYGKTLTNSNKKIEYIIGQFTQLIFGRTISQLLVTSASIKHLSQYGNLDSRIDKENLTTWKLVCKSYC